MDKELMWFFLNKRSGRLILSLEELNEPCPEYISSETGMPFDETVEALEALESMGFAVSKSEAGDRYFSLTPLGRALSENLKEIERIFRKWPGGNSKSDVPLPQDRNPLKGGA